ncbi:hypothetical protein M885DRAFT_610946 [Pelagophyceae sp. CCMP2097]|nr:hypothetical protein M885DRAFT_610946 [Pelagophyceae sp. CCMP2097]|mmetsp:Transcript_15564/g.52474  ORF Transcript_15564/g.52474 Transcript_15564/m.52474 type:complete len:229 (+) Transcript_15564:106-792(+)
MIPTNISQPEEEKKVIRLRPPKLIVAAVLVVTIFVMLPLTVREACLIHGLGEERAYHVAKRATKYALFAVGACFVVALRFDLQANLEARRLRLREAEIAKQCYKCIRPQEEGVFVVFPVHVLRRGVAMSKVVTIDDESLKVELATDADRGVSAEMALTQLLEAALVERFTAGTARAIVFIGKDSGPTGLAGGLALRSTASPDLLLGVKCGHFLMDASAQKYKDLNTKK